MPREIGSAYSLRVRRKTAEAGQDRGVGKRCAMSSVETENGTAGKKQCSEKQRIANAINSLCIMRPAD